MSFLSTDCELSSETCSKNVYSFGPWIPQRSATHSSSTGFSLCIKKLSSCIRSSFLLFCPKCEWIAFAQWMQQGWNLPRGIELVSELTFLPVVKRKALWLVRKIGYQKLLYIKLVHHKKIILFLFFSFDRSTWLFPRNFICVGCRFKQAALGITKQLLLVTVVLPFIWSLLSCL